MMERKVLSKVLGNFHTMVETRNELHVHTDLLPQRYMKSGHGRSAQLDHYCLLFILCEKGFKTIKKRCLSKYQNLLTYLLKFPMKLV